MLRRVLTAAFGRVVRLYFRTIERTGVPPDATTRGRLVVANHPNALIDPLVVLTDAAACPLAPVAKSTLWSIPVLRWLLDAVDAVPVVRRVDRPDKAAGDDDTFAAVARHLERGGNLLIFPEGTSHSGPRLAPLRTGAARMLLEAEPARASEPLTFQAAALEFEHPELFRSRCLIAWGPVRRVDEVVAGVDEHEARVAAITARMRADLEELLIEGATPAERLLAARVARLLAHELGDASLGTWSELGRRVEVARAVLARGDHGRVEAVRRAVDAYHGELDRLGLRDEQLATARAGARRPPRVGLALIAPLAAAGALLYGLPYLLPRRIARSADPDAVSTYKLASALVIYPVWMGGLVAVSLALLPPGTKLLGAAIAIASPFAALAWLDALDDRAPSVAADDLRRAADLRAAALAAIEAARAAAGL